LRTKARSAVATSPATRISTVARFAPVSDATSVGRSCRGIWWFARFVATGSIQPVRAMAKSPFSVMYAAMPRNMNVMRAFKLPPPMRTSVLLPQPEPSVMPTPNRNPPRTYESQVTVGRT
jgi:hypothetical protein